MDYDSDMESNYKSKIEEFLKEQGLEEFHLHLYLDSIGYVTVKKEEYDNMECVDPDKPCP